MPVRFLRRYGFSDERPGWTGEFFRLALANTVSNLMVPLAGLIDTAFLGHLSELKYLNGVAIATVIFNVIYWGFNFFRMGTTGPVAQAVGQNNTLEVWLIGTRNALLALLSGVLVYLLKDPIAQLGFSLLEAGPDVREAAIAFFNGRIIGAPAVLVNFVLLGWLVGQGKGRAVVALAVVSNGCNIALDYCFIHLLGWGSHGAGLATAISQYVLLASGLMWIARGGIPWHLWSGIKPRLAQLSALKSLFSLNFDILVRTFSLVMAMSFFTQVSAGLGDMLLGVNTLILQIVLMSAYFIDGVALATESYAGRFYGRRAVSDLRWLLLLGAGGSLVLGLGVSLTLMGWPLPFFQLLTGHDELLVVIPDYVGWLVPVLGLGAIAFTLDGYFLGLTAGRILRNSTLIAVAIGFLPFALMARTWQQPHFLWLALTGLMSLRVFTLGRQVSATLEVQTAKDAESAAIS